MRLNMNVGSKLNPIPSYSKPIDWCVFLGQARELFQAMCVCDAKVQWRATSYRWQFLEGTGMFLAILEIDHPILVPDGFGGDPWFHYSTKQTKQTEWHSSKFLIVHFTNRTRWAIPAPSSATLYAFWLWWEGDTKHWYRKVPLQLHSHNS